MENPVLSLHRAFDCPEMCPAEHVVNRGRRSRRDWLRETSRLALGIPLGALPLSGVFAASAWPNSAPALPPQNSALPLTPISSLFSSDPTKYRFTLEEDRFLEQIERACFQFFFGTKPVPTQAW